MPQSPPEISSQVALEASPVMAQVGETKNMPEDEKAFIKSFFDMTQMVKVLYEEMNMRLQQGESSNPPKGDGDNPPKREWREW